MTGLDLILGIWAAVIVLAVLDALLRRLVSPATIDRWADRIFR